MQTMSKFTLILILTGILGLLSAPAQSDRKLNNQLAGSASPYLAMHAQDPTAWQLWSGITITKARTQKKLLFVSVGYFSCHWCHVMQRESYQNKEIASFINQHFIPVKIDRETEPALDAHLIAFADQSQGYSGWPLNVFLTPDGYPLYATVYLPPKDFLQLIQKLQKLWSDSPDELSKLAAAEQKGGNGPGQSVRQKKLARQLRAAVDQVALQIGSPLNGGFGDASKFPSSPQLDFLLTSIGRGSDKSLKEFLELTLNAMANNGLRDHLGGGFFRYTVDPGWKTPHFEKMLYDNAQLARVYMKAAKIYQSQEYETIAKSTLQFMQREMMDSRGALIASFSAIDDKDIEGGYYLWQIDELKSLLSTQEWQAYQLYAGMTDPSPIDDGYLPMRAMPVSELATQLKLSTDETDKLIATVETKMLAHRVKRVLPHDEKLLAGWNGLALSAFATGAMQFGDREYRMTARKIRNYLVQNLWDGEQLLRASKNGASFGQASLEDYAYVAEGLYHWAALTGKSADYGLARSVVLQAWRRYYGKQGWRLSEPGLIPMESPVDVMADGPMPAPSAVVINTSLKLARQLRDSSLRKRALAALNSGQKLISSDPFWYATQISAMGEK